MSLSEAPEGTAAKRRRRAPKIGRGEWIRTTDPSVPNRVLYQAEPRPDKGGVKRQLPATAGNRRAEISFYFKSYLSHNVR